MRLAQVGTVLRRLSTVQINIGISKCIFFGTDSRLSEKARQIFVCSFMPCDT